MLVDSYVKSNLFLPHVFFFFLGSTGGKTPHLIFIDCGSFSQPCFYSMNGSKGASVLLRCVTWETIYCTRPLQLETPLLVASMPIDARRPCSCVAVSSVRVPRGRKPPYSGVSICSSSTGRWRWQSEPAAVAVVAAGVASFWLWCALVCWQSEPHVFWCLMQLLWLQAYYCRNWTHCKLQIIQSQPPIGEY